MVGLVLLQSRGRDVEGDVAEGHLQVQVLADVAVEEQPRPEVPQQVVVAHGAGREVRQLHPQLVDRVLVPVGDVDHQCLPGDLRQRAPDLRAEGPGGLTGGTATFHFLSWNSKSEGPSSKANSSSTAILIRWKVWLQAGVRAGS